MSVVYLDLETYCDVPISFGGYRYAERAEVMLVAFAIGSGPARVWDLTTNAPCPEDLDAAMRDPSVLVRCHNVGFDRTVLRALKARGEPWLQDWPLDIDRFYCTMAQAQAHGLPGALDKLCAVYALPEEQRKIKSGRDLMMLFCKPRPKNVKLRRATRVTHPTEWSQFINYAAHDITSMRVLYGKMPRWNFGEREQAIWRLDQLINDRGPLMDLDLCRAAVRACSRQKGVLDERTQELTSGLVNAATQRDVLLAHLLNEEGVDLPDMRADTLERRLEDPNLSDAARELISIRLQSSKTSNKKYVRILEGVSKDGRLRGMFNYCGAIRTGRWSGRIAQLHNWPRPTLPPEDINAGIEAMKIDCEDLLDTDVNVLASNAIRGTIVAPSGHKLCVADYSNIEGRGTAWVADEPWKLQAFRDYDAGHGPDLYKVAYARSFLIDPADVDSWQRQIGKVMELALGYGGGVGAFVTMALNYGIDLQTLVAALAVIPARIRGEAEDFWTWAVENKKTLGLPKDVFIVCDSLKRLWREAHPRLCDRDTGFWSQLESGVRTALRNPNVIHTVGPLKIRSVSQWVHIELPSGRSLSYPAVKVNDKGELTYLGINQYSRQWQRLKTYSGKLMENVVQALSRDVMADAMPRVEAKRYRIVVHVHDELVTEVPATTDYSVEELCWMMSDVAWLPGFPIAAHGFETTRYRKE